MISVDTLSIVIKRARRRFLPYPVVSTAETVIVSPGVFLAGLNGFKTRSRSVKCHRRLSVERFEAGMGKGNVFVGLGYLGVFYVGLWMVLIGLE